MRTTNDQRLPILELQSRFAGRIGDCLDASVINVATAIEHHLGDALLLGQFGDLLADGLGRGDVAAGGALALFALAVEAAASVLPWRSSITCT